MNVANTYLITQPIFQVRKNEEGKKIVHHCSIINYGKELKNRKVNFVNKNGKQSMYPHQFDSSISLVRFNDICLENLMHSWKRNNKESKPVVLDESIDTHEVYENEFSTLKIMIERRENEIAIKPLF